MGPIVDHAEELPTAARVDRGDESAHWTADELSAMTSLGGGGRVLCVRPTGTTRAVEACLQQSGYRIGRLSVTRESTHLPLAAASFQPDLIYVGLTEPVGECIAALEALATDPRTREFPLVALIPVDADASVIEDAYTRSGCDFLRLGATPIELIARTHLLVRLSRRAAGLGEPETALGSEETAANGSAGTRLDLRDKATGVYSATYLRHRLQQEIARAHRYQRPLTVLGVYSRDAQRDDRAAQIATVLGMACRNVDLVARLESDSFVVLLPETTGEDAQVVVARIERDLVAKGLSAKLGAASLGGSEDDGAYSASSLVRLACARANS